MPAESVAAVSVEKLAANGKEISGNKFPEAVVQAVAEAEEMVDEEVVAAEEACWTHPKDSTSYLSNHDTFGEEI